MKYPFSVFKSELQEIKRYSESDTKTIREMDRRLNSLFNDDIVAWTIYHLNHLSLDNKKYKSIDDYLPEIGIIPTSFRLFPNSLDILLEHIESSYVSKVIKKLHRDNDLLTFEYLEELHSSRMITGETFEQEKNRYLKTLLIFVSFVGENSSYYRDAQLLVFEGILNQEELDKSIKSYNDILRKM